MKKSDKKNVEFRFYEKPVKEPVLVLKGEDWNRYYGLEIDTVHFHNLMEIGYCLRGKGEMIVQKDRMEYRDGNFTIIPPNILHDTRSEHIDQWQYLFLDVDELVDSRYREQPEMAEKILRSIRKNGQMYHRDTDHALSEMILAVFEQAEQRGPYYVDSIQSLLLAAVLQLAASNERQEEAPILNCGKEGKITQALFYVNECYNKEIMVSELAERCHLSESHFRRVFWEEMNMTPVEYVNLVRVQAACDLMRKGNWHMEEVAIKVGYQAMSTFNRNFRRIVGARPYQWKKKLDTQFEKLENYHIRALKGW